MTTTPVALIRSISSASRWAAIAVSMTMLAVMTVLAVMVVSPATAEDLGDGQLQIAGLRLAVTPEAQTVPFDTPTIIATSLEGFDTSTGVPSGLRALGDLSGPEIDGALTLETVPGQPFRIPRLKLGGAYRLDDIRLVEGDDLLAYASPRSVTVTVTEILVTRVTSRALTLDEIRGYGIVISDDSFQALNFTFGFGLDGDEVTFDVPVLLNYAAGTARVIAPGMSREWLPPSPRFAPPPVMPFTFQIQTDDGPDVPTGGCPPRAIGFCLSEFSSPPLAGVLVFPTDVGLLHQFFSVVLMVQNGAPDGDVLTVRDLTARIQIPPGLRQAETAPPTPLGVPVPVRVPGPDGELGTGDDLTFLIAQATGEAEFLLEGLREGTHVVDFALEGVLDGLPTGPQRIRGTSRGAVVVRDPQLQVTINHPDVVRDGEPYPLRLTVSNIGPAPVNLVSLTLPVSGVSGADVVGSRTRTIASLAPGDAESVVFDLVARTTGRVVASTAKSGSSIAPNFEFSVGVSNDIPLSPDTLVLPKSTGALPASIVDPALSLLGLGHSLATASETDLAPHLPRVTSNEVQARVYRLAQAGRHLALGDDLFDNAAILAAELDGSRDGFLEWDALRRTSPKGLALADGVAAIFDQEATATSEEAMFDRWVATTGFLPPRIAALTSGPGTTLGLSSTGGALTGTGGSAVRTLPFGTVYPLTDGAMATVTTPTDADYRIEVRGTGSTDLHVLVPAADGTQRVARWQGVALTADDVAFVDVTQGHPVPDLQIDRFADGAIDQTLTPTLDVVPPRPFLASRAVQNIEVDPSGHVVDILFSGDVDPASLDPRDPDHFALPGRVSNGGFVERGDWGTTTSASLAAQRNFRMVRVVFDNPLDPLASNDLLIEDVGSALGTSVVSQSLPVEINASTVGAPVEGVVIGPDGQPVAFAEVHLYEHDAGYVSGCVAHKTAAVRADAHGHFRFDFVRGDTCDPSNRFRIEALDPIQPWYGEVTGRVRISGESVQLNVVMLGRGRIEGSVRFDDGTVPEGVQVLAYNDVFQEGTRATVLDDGRYFLTDVVVGTVTLSAHDAQGNFVFATVELPLAGAIVTHNLIVPRASPVQTGQVRGIVVATDGATPVEDAFVALYVDARLIGVRLSAADGRFDFGIVPAGIVEVEVFHPESHLTGGQLFFEVEPDEVRDVTVVLRDDRGSIQGHVYRQAIDGTLTPIANAVVWVHLQSANTVTDATGGYRLDGVLTGTVQVRGADPVTGRGLSGSVTVTEDGTATRDLYLVEDGPAGGITGQVLGFDGQPVAGAIVHIANGHPNPLQWHHSTTTDAQGHFVLIDVGPGTHAVHAVSGSQGGLSLVTVRFPGDTPTTAIRFKRGEIRLETKVRQTDGALIGVKSQVQVRRTIVRFELVGLAGHPSGVETDANGNLVLTNSLVGEYELFVSNPFHGEKLIRGVLVNDGDIAEHEVIFEPNGAVRGTVLDHDGTTPVVGATVTIDHRDLIPYDVTSDASGAFAFELVPPGSFNVYASIDGLLYRTARVYGHLSRPGEILDGLAVVLPKQGAVRGQVLDSNGAPVAGAVVELREHGYPRRLLTANADQDGRFAFDNVFAGEVALRAQAPALGGLGGRAEAEITDEGETVEVMITLEDTGELIGQVTSPVDGSLVPFAEVTLRGAGGGRFVDAVHADDIGSFRFRLLPLGPYEVRAFDASTGRFGRNTDAVIAANGEVITADIVLQARGEVDGHLTEPEEGAPVPAATIKLNSTTPFFQLETYSSTDAQGYFLFGGIPAGPFRLTTQEPGSRRRASGTGEIVHEDERVTVDLIFERYGTVRGAVVNPPGVDPGLFPNVNTRAISRSGSSVVVGATLDNPFAFEGLLPNEHFELYAEEVGGTHRGRTYARMDADGNDMTVDVEIVALGDVRVAVVDSFGTPVTGVDVRIVSQGSLGVDVRSGATGSDHEVVFEGVMAGAVSVSAQNPVSGLRGSAAGALTLEGQDLLLTISLQDTGFVRGRVLLSDGITPGADVLAVLQEGGRFHYAGVAADGAFEFAGIRLGAYELILQEPLGDGQYGALGVLDANGEIDDFGDLVLDEHDPSVVALFPAAGSRDVPLGALPTVTFSEAIDATRFVGNSTAFIRPIGAYNNHMTVPSWSVDGTVVTLTPNQPLTSGTAYELIVLQSVFDQAGRRLQEAARATFYTADVIPPAVIAFTPVDGAVEVPIDSPVLVTFSEPVDAFSLSGTALQLHDLTTSTGVSTTFQLRPGEREVIVTPVGGLIADHQYRLTVQNVSDTAGNVQTNPAVTSFWAPDETLPMVTWTAPASGDAFVAGDLMTVSVHATDNRGIARVAFEVSGRLYVDDTAPYSVDLPVPPVTQAGDLVLRATAVDLYDNATVAARSIVVSPNPNASVPTIETPCLNEGDRVRADVALTVPVVFTDDETIDRYALLVDGVLIDEFDQGTSATVEHTFTWTPPAHAVAGDRFVLRLEARDYAGNTTAVERGVEIPSELLLSGDQVLDASYDGQDLALVDGTFTVTGPLDLASLSVMPGASVVPVSGTSTTGGLDIVTAGTLRVQCGGTIAADAVGLAGGTSANPEGQAPAGLSGSTSDAGGSHGGSGLAWDAGAGGETYDSVYWPTMPGAGGSFDPAVPSGSGGVGGGTVHLDAAELVVAGLIGAQGQKTGNHGAGGGGSITVRASVVRGAGLIDAAGGEQKGSPSTYCTGVPAGSGGGGRVAFAVDTFEDFDPATQARARGGRRVDCFGNHIGYGGAGTVLATTTAEPWGALYLDAGTVEDGARFTPTTRMPTLGEGMVTAVTTAGDDRWITGTEAFRPRWVGAAMILRDAQGADLGTFRVGEVDAAGRVRLIDAGGATGGIADATTYQGAYRFDRLSTKNGIALVFDDPLLGSLTLEDDFTVAGQLILDDLTITQGATLRSGAGLPLDLIIAGTLTVDAGARIDASHQGYAGGIAGAPDGVAPSWVTPPSPNAGGSHGGAGILWRHPHYDPDGPPGDVYDSVYWPTLPGGGGARRSVQSVTENGRPGGGRVTIDATTVVLDGDILARGMADDSALAAAGAGGSVAIRTQVLTGAGTINVAGGDTDKVVCPSFTYAAVAGAGGGGRVGLWVATTLSFDVATQVTAHGGANRCLDSDVGEYAAPGTIYLLGPNALDGHLIIDNGASNRPADATLLPTLGTGGVVAWADDGLDAWLTADRTLHPRWIGATMALRDNAGVTLGAYRIMALDDTGRARLGGAAGLLGAASFAGEYRFDRVDVGHGGGLDTTDPLTVDEMVVAGTSSLGGTANGLTAGSLTFEADAFVQLTESVYRFVVAGDLTIETGAVIDATGIGYPGADYPILIGGAPAAVDGAEGKVGGSHGGISQGPTPATAFDSVYHPRRAGGGGGTTNTHGLAGGGALIIEATGDVRLDGTLNARGETRDHGLGGAGAGGTVSITAARLSGTGHIDVSGGFYVGSANQANGKGGGGGRVALWVGDLSGFNVDTQTNTDGGARDVPNGTTIGYASPGTVFTFDQAAVHGDLLIRQRTRDTEPLPDTPLPAAGQGTIDTVVVDATDPDDAWVTADAANALFDLGLEGMQLRVEGVDYPIVAQSEDRTQLLLDGAAGQVLTGDDYVGVYRFDTVRLDGGVTVVLGDLDEVGLYDVGDGTVVRLIENEAPVIDSVTPASGTVFLQGDAILATAVVTDNQAVADVTFTMDGQSIVDTTDPYEATFVAPTVTIGTDLDLTVTATDAQNNTAATVHAIRIEPGDPPVIVEIQPADGTLYSDGQPVVVTATVTDDDELAQVSLTFDGQTLVDTAAPWTWTVTAPAVTEPTAYALTVDAVDAQGNTASAVRTIHVEPGTAGPPPVLVVDPCPADGDLVVPSTALAFAFGASADDGIEGWDVTVNGTTIDSASGLISIDEIAISLPWTVPAAAGPGDVFSVEITVVTYGGGVATETLTLTVAAAGYLTGPQNLDAIHNGTNLVLGAGVFSVTESLDLASLTLMKGAVMGATSVLDVSATGTINVICGATIDLEGGGYAGGSTSDQPGEAPPWVTASTSNAGGSHGGMGASGAHLPGIAGEVYGSVYLPSLGGGGGGAYHGADTGGAGGGVITLEAQTLVVNGSINARGESRSATVPPKQNYDGGGAGGSILITSDILRGGGSIDASGGKYTAGPTNYNAPGGGSGGRVALWVTHTLDFDDSNLFAHGGTSKRNTAHLRPQAAAGTIFVAGPAAIHGRLIVDGGPETEPTAADTVLPSLGSDGIAAWTTEGADAWLTATSGALLPRWLGVSVALFDSTGSLLGEFPAGALATDGRLRLLGAALVSGATTFEGRYHFDATTLRHGSRLDATDALDLGDVVIADASSLPPEVTASSVTVLDGGVLTATQGKLTLDVAGTVTVEAGATIGVDGSGYRGGATSGLPGEAPLWVSASTSNAGGSHGGKGGSGGHLPGVAGEVYGNVYFPSLGGGGGGAFEGADSGGGGGGALTILAHEVVLDGSIMARGENRDATVPPRPRYDGAGAGGAVLIAADIVRGTGSIDASGGSYIADNSSSNVSGGGGGGRVALWAHQSLALDVDSNVIAYGGTTKRNTAHLRPQAAPGTVLVAGPGMAYGRLIIDGGADATSELGLTPLPRLGTADVAAQETVHDDVWLTAASGPLPPRWLGAEVVLFDAAGTGLGTFAVVDRSTDGRILVEDAAAVGTVATFEGRYRFDAVTVRNHGQLDADDVLDVGDVMVTGSGALPPRLTAQSLSVATGSILGATRGRLALDVAGVMTIEAGSVIDLDGGGYRGGATSGLPGEAPAWVTASDSNAGGSHGGAGARGGEAPGVAGEVFGSVYRPALGGGGGGAYYDAYNTNTGGAGGGQLTIAAQEVVLDGSITVRGEDRDATASPPQYYDGGGAGGAVYIAADILRGNGAIDASGGHYTAHGIYSPAAGGGGGGRVALWAHTSLLFDADANVVVHGGTSQRGTSHLRPPAAPGTLLVAGPGMDHGRLIIDGGADATGDLGVTTLPSLGTGTVAAFDVVIDDAWLTAASGPLPPRWLGAEVVLFDAAGTSLGTFATIDVASDGRLLLDSAGSVSAAVTYEGRYRFDGVTLRNHGQLDMVDPLDAGDVVVTGSGSLPPTLDAQSVTVSTGGVLGATQGGLALDVTGVVTIEAGGAIDLDGGGYRGGATSGLPGEAPAGVSASGSNAGGSHGGAGAKGGQPGLAGDVFDSVYLPSYGGGGGGAYYNAYNVDTGGAGGGVLTIAAQEVVVDGSITARGESRDATASPPQYYDGGGAGGTVLISTPILRGTGSIDVSGGSYSAHGFYNDASGGGGGGRVALWVDQTLAFDTTTGIVAFGGTSKRNSAALKPQAAAGTIFVAGPSATHGDLRVDAGPNNGSDPITDTALPAMGSDTVGVVDVATEDPADVWIEPNDAQATFALGSTGMWIRIAGTDYRVLDEAANRRRLRIAGGAGVVTVGDSYEGVYKFDTVFVRRGATVVIPDRADVGTFDVDADSDVQTQALFLPPDWLSQPPWPAWGRSTVLACRPLEKHEVHAANKLWTGPVLLTSLDAVLLTLAAKGGVR